MKKFFNEFKEFISKGNVMDMAIGVIIATAFGKITTSLVNDVFMPLIGMLIGGIDLGTLNITLSPAVVDEAGAVVKEAVVVGIGTFLTTVRFHSGRVRRVSGRQGVQLGQGQAGKARRAGTRARRSGTHEGRAAAHRNS